VAEHGVLREAGGRKGSQIPSFGMGLCSWLMQDGLLLARLGLCGVHTTPGCVAGSVQ